MLLMKAVEEIIIIASSTQVFQTDLFRTSVLRASPSMSSAIMIRGFLCVLANSSAGMIACTFETFFSQNRISASWNSHLAPTGRNDTVTELLIYWHYWFRVNIIFTEHKIAIQGKGPDDKSTRKPLAYQESKSCVCINVQPALLRYLSIVLVCQHHIQKFCGKI